MRPRPARSRWSPITSAVAVMATGLTGKVVNDRARLIIPFVAFIPWRRWICIYRELKAVQLTTINKERAEIICDHWITCR